VITSQAVGSNSHEVQNTSSPTKIEHSEKVDSFVLKVATLPLLTFILIHRKGKTNEKFFASTAQLFRTAVNRSCDKHRQLEQ
jgi:hypothetical protein